MFVYRIIPLSIKRNSKIIWRNQIPNSSECLRPVYLIREKENDHVLLNYVLTSTDNARDTINKNGLFLSFDDISLNISITIKDTMKDLKLKKCLSGLGGADCIICFTKKIDWMDIKQIEEGFPINRSAEETLKLYHSLVDEDGKITTKPNDFMVRQGLTQKPLTTSDQHSITITHSYINITTWFLKLLYRLNQEYFVWREKKTVLGDILAKS